MKLVCSLGWTHFVSEVSHQVPRAWVIYDGLGWITQLSSTHLLQPSSRLVWALRVQEEKHTSVSERFKWLLCHCLLLSPWRKQITGQSQDGEVLARGVGADRHVKERAISVVFLRRREERRSEWCYLGRSHWLWGLEAGWC